MIPKYIHQIYLGDDMPASMLGIIEALRGQNPDHTHKLWGSREAERFILAHYGRDALNAYDRIDPVYYAAKADLLRYLIIHQLGGVYLDGKSRFNRPISDVIKGDEGHILTQWETPTMGRHRRLSHVEGGEYCNWHVIAEAGHPFLKAVIDRVLRNIERFRPWHNVGRAGVLLLTGPIAYTLAIQPLREKIRHRFTTNEELGLEYSAPGYDQSAIHHYSDNSAPVIRMGRLGNALSAGAQRLRTARA